MDDEKSVEQYIRSYIELHGEVPDLESVCRIFRLMKKVRIKEESIRDIYNKTVSEIMAEVDED